jgi:PAS domain-containing protein
MPLRVLLAAAAALPAAGVLALTRDAGAAAAALALGAASTWLAWAAANRALASRVERLAAAADRIAAGDDAARAGLRRAGLGRLGRALDLLAAAHAARLREVALLDLASDGLVVLDAGGRVVYANAAAERLLGAARAELEGRELEERARGLDLEREERPIVEGGRSVATAVALRARR